MTTINELKVIKWKNYIHKFTKNIDNQTHLAFNGGKYNIDDDNYNEFYKTYYNNLIQDNEELYIIEKVQNCRFAYFLDIEIPKGETDIILSIEQVINIVDITKSLVKVFFEENNLLIKNIISKRTINVNYTKYHVNFPNLIVTSNIAQILTKQVISKLTDNLIKVVDISVYRTGLRLFGSKKSKTDSIKEKTNYGDHNYQSVYSLLDKETKDISFNEFSELIVRRKNDTLLTKTTKQFQELLLTKSIKEIIKPKVTSVSNEILKEIERYLLFIKDTDIKGIFEHYTFNSIGKIVSKQNSLGVFCYYITLLERWCPFVSREHKRESTPIYAELTISGFSIKCYDEDCLTLKYGMCPLDDSFAINYPQLYLSMNTKYYKSEINLTQETRHLLEDSLCMSHFKIAKVAYHIYKERFRIDELKNPEWYEFDGSKWKKSYIMNILISEDLPRYYRAIKIKNENANIKDITELATNQDTLETNVRNELINIIIGKLENVSFKKNILIEMYYLFKQLEPNFISKLDSNPYLIGFNNGVYDLKDNIFRKGELKDYITFTTGYDYIEYNSDSIEVKEIYEFIGKIITNKKVFEYLLKILGRSLLGIPDEKFYIFTGLHGANGKSTLINFLEDTLNSYNTAVDVSLLTNKRALSSSASPDVIRLRGKRIVSFAEPEYGDTLKVGILKAFSGGDSIIARELYKSPISFKLQASMILICNDVPAISNIDGGTLRRLRVIEFKSVFCDNPTKPNEFLIDPTLKDKMKIWRPYFMSILIHWYTIYQEELRITKKIETPKEVTQATDKYKNDNDKFNDFFEESVKESTTIVSMRDIYRLFCIWWTNNNGGTNYKIPDIKELIRAMKLKYNEDDYTLYKGFRVDVDVNVDDNVDNVVDDLI